MKKLTSFFISLTLLLSCNFIIPTNVHAAENNTLVAYKISIPINYSQINTSDIKSITLHYGMNGWQNVKNIKMDRHVVDYYMGKTFEAFTTVVYVKKNSTLDYCFKEDFYNKCVKWNNNNNKDFHIYITKSNVPN